MNKSHSFFKTAAVITALLIFTVSSCNAFSGTKTNKKYDEKGMKTLTGQKIKIDKRDDIYTDQEFGFGFIVPSSFKSLNDEGLLEILPRARNITLFSLYSRNLHDLVSEMNPAMLTEEAFLDFAQKAEKYIFEAAFLFRLPSGEPKGEDAEILDYLKNHYSVCEKIADFSGNAYYFGYNSDYTNTELSDDEKTKAGTLIDELKDFKKNIFVFPPLLRADEASAVPDSVPASAALTSFEAQTLTGETVTQDIFKDYKVTMINIWAPWCSPCVKEMPDLAKLHDSMLPQGTNMISICIDSDSDPQGARDILNKVSAHFTTLIPNAGLAEFLNGFSAIPSTVFVDSEGNFIGKTVTGVPGRGEPAEAYAKILAELASSQN